MALDLDKFTNTIKQAVELLNENVQEGHDSEGGSYVKAFDNYTTIEETVEWLNQNMKLRGIISNCNQQQ